MFRLFGKNSKRDTGPHSPEGSNASPGLEEREGIEGFTVLDPKQNAPVGGQDVPPSYNSVAQQLPYQLPGRSVPASPVRQNSTFSHPLAGVQFSLSPRLTTDSELQYITAAVDSVLAKIKGVEWAAFDYSFTLEQSVVGTQHVEEGVEGLDLENNQ